MLLRDADQPELRALRHQVPVLVAMVPSHLIHNKKIKKIIKYKGIHMIKNFVFIEDFVIHIDFFVINGDIKQCQKKREKSLNSK